jgi:hypothetical protein
VSRALVVALFGLPPRHRSALQLPGVASIEVSLISLLAGTIRKNGFIVIKNRPCKVSRWMA